MRSRVLILQLSFYGAFLIIVGRLFYWQVLKSESLRAIAQSQYQQQLTLQGSRGKIISSDGYVLVDNKPVYRLFAEPSQFSQPIEKIIDSVATGITANEPSYIASEAAVQTTIKDQLATALTNKLNSKPDAKWLRLLPKIHQQTKNHLDSLSISGIGFDGYEVRDYPEGPLAAHILGFVGKNKEGFDVGYFGIEGGLDKELQMHLSKHQITANPFGFFVMNQASLKQTASGRDVVLTIRRDIQYLAEIKLATALEQYGAKAGEVVIMDPSTGEILAAASLPSYHPEKFYESDPTNYRNPIVSDIFEPGSTFKVLTVAAGIEHGKITPETKCPRCSGPRTIDKYTIKTWNEEYHPDVTITEALALSDNVAMVYVAELLGIELFKKTIQHFGIGDHTTYDLQEDRDTPFPQKWGPVELATRSFGQGITTTSLQLVRAIAAIANHGVMMQPHLVKQVIEPQNRTYTISPVAIRQVVSQDTARQVTDMLVHAAEDGEAKWVSQKRLEVAGKTGTAQIANQTEGGYLEDQTLASFVGFAPASEPRFVMLVKLTAPTSSPWAAETAAPLWYDIAEQLFLLLDIPYTPLDTLPT